MATSYCTGPATWYAHPGSSNFGNSGVRLQVGRKVDSGSTVWINRSGLQFHIPGSVLAATVTAATLRLSARGTHSCFTIGAGPMMYVSGALNASQTLAQNPNSGECTVGAAGGAGAMAVYPGFSTTTTHRKSWSGTPAVGDLVDIDVLSLYQDFLAFGNTEFLLMLTAQDETITSQAIAWDGQDTGTAPQLILTYTTNEVPDVSGSAGRVPANGSRQTLANCQIFKGTYVDTEDNAAGLGPQFVDIQVATDSAFTSLVLDQSIAPTSYNASTKQWVSNRTIAGLVRGTTYYWRYKLTDQTPEVSAWSPTFTFIPNRLPVNTKVRPT